MKLLFETNKVPAQGYGLCIDAIELRQIERELANKEIRLEHLTYHDALTNLPNKYLLQDRLARALTRADRNQSKVALIFLDLDKFKKINESLGHQVGDALLVGVARRLQSALQDLNTIARFSGDQFAIIVDNLHDIDQVARVAQRVIDCFGAPFMIAGHSCYISVSIGVSQTLSSHVNAETLMKRADIAMAAAKKKGRNNFQFYSQEMDARAHDLLLLENDLRRALTDNQFILYYQPQFDLTSGRIRALEALVRWRHPQRGIVRPDEFIPIAEENGIIVPLGQWILKTACTFTRRLQQRCDPDLRICVNISMHQFKTRDFPAVVSQVLRETGLKPGSLELEITESLAMENAAETIERLNALKKMGVLLAIDDFGKGYSSLSHLKHLPIDTLKIDRGFISAIHEDRYDLAITETILALAEKLDLDVVAEGIETEQQKQLLTQIGCKTGQGFLFSRPVAEVEMLALLKNVGRMKSSSRPIGQLLGSWLRDADAGSHAAQ